MIPELHDHASHRGGNADAFEHPLLRTDSFSQVGQIAANLMELLNGLLDGAGVGADDLFLGSGNLFLGIANIAFEPPDLALEVGLAALKRQDFGLPDQPFR